MTTMETETTDTISQIADSTSAYLERLQQSHERFAEVVGSVRARNARISDKFIETIIAGQRDALELGKTVAAQPAAFGKNLEAVMQSLTAAQERALELSKTLYRAQTEAAADARALTERLLDSSKNFGKPFGKISALWMPAAK